MANGEFLIGERLKMLERPSLERPQALGKLSGEKTSDGDGQKVSFGELLTKSMAEVNRAGVNADREVNLSITGKATNPHGALLALQEAEISFNLMTSIKDRLEQAYQQLVRMQL